jgi:hypothetical protein
LKFRRKQDRIILGLAIVVILGGFWAYTQGCTSKGPTIPDPVVNQPAPPAPVAVNPQPVQPVVPTATPKPELPLWVNCDAATGICTFGTDKPRPVSAKCTKPAENDPFYGTWSAVINDGDTVDVRNICHKIEPNDCSPKTVPVQIDFQGMGRHLGHLGPLYQLTFPQKLDPKECEECVEWKEPKISCGEYGECHPHPAVLAPACFEHAECLKTWNCKDPEPFEDTRSCVCKECIEEGPYEGDIVWDETIHEGRCPVVSALNGVPLECHQNGTQTITWDCQDPTEAPACRNVECPCEITWEFSHSYEIWEEWGECHDGDPSFTASSGDSCSQQRTGERYDVYVNNCDQRTREDGPFPLRDSQSCDCEEDPGICHVSNKGGKDGQMNLVLTQKGHEQHLNASKFCPPDHRGACSCAQAIADAQACGIVATGGFFCK